MRPLPRYRNTRLRASAGQPAYFACRRLACFTRNQPASFAGQPERLHQPARAPHPPAARALCRQTQAPPPTVPYKEGNHEPSSNGNGKSISDGGK